MRKREENMREDPRVYKKLPRKLPVSPLAIPLRIIQNIKVAFVAGCDIIAIIFKVF